MSDRTRLNSKLLRVTFAKHSGPLCTGDSWGWSFAQSSRAPLKLMVWKDYSEKLPLCQCQVCASDNAELDDASFMLLSYEGYEFYNVKSSVRHTSTFFPLLLVKFRKKDVLKAEMLAELHPITRVLYIKQKRTQTSNYAEWNAIVNSKTIFLS